MRERSFNINSVSISSSRNFNQERIQEEKLQKKRDKEINKISEKLNNKRIRNLVNIAKDKKVE
jgi:hypothetical protein